MVRGLVVASAIGMMLSLGCKSGEPSGGSDGACSGGTVEMVQIYSGHSCSAIDMPTVTMEASTLNCPVVKRPASSIAMDCSGSASEWERCKFYSFEFTGLSLLSPVTFEGAFHCGSDPALIAQFSPNQIPGKANPPPTEIEVDFVVP